MIQNATNKASKKIVITIDKVANNFNNAHLE